MPEEQGIVLNGYDKTTQRELLIKIFVPFFFWYHLMVIPGLVFLFWLFARFNEPVWKLGMLVTLIILATFFFAFERFRYRKGARADTTLALNLLGFACIQIPIFYLTGGIESPLLPVAPLYILLANTIFERGRWGVIIYAAYSLGLAVMVLGDYFNILPHAGPSFFQLEGGFKAKPAFFWFLFFTYIVLFNNTMFVSRSLSRYLASYFQNLVETRTEVVDSFKGRMREMETIGSRVAHEIKNPLASVTGLVQLMARNLDPKAEKDRKRMDVIQEELARIDGIVTEFSNFTRPLDSIRLAPLDLIQFLKAVEALYEMRLARQRVRFILSYGQDAAIMIQADKQKLKQVLINLLENALAAMPLGGMIHLTVEKNIAEKRVDVSISDTGYGIAPEHLEKLFEPFFTTKADGTGLGLTIARGIVRQHKGELTISSTVNKGARSVISLPMG